jgi:hypothetical protein
VCVCVAGSEMRVVHEILNFEGDDRECCKRAEKGVGWMNERGVEMLCEW